MSNSLKKKRKCRSLIRRYGNLCTYCNVALTEPAATGTAPPTTRTLDHLLPKAKGGASDLTNLVLACFACNQRKGTLLPIEFILSRSARP
jgi:5-methylcytosine-specific restriction endonuclease McrA